MNDNFEMIRQELALSYFMALFEHLTRGTTDKLKT